MNRVLEASIQYARRLIASASVRLLPRASYHGIEVASFTGQDDYASQFERIAQALDLIALYDPRRLRRIQQDLQRIAVVGRGGEVYDHGLRTYLADRNVLARRSIEEVALAIVHEATHARLRRVGVITTDYNQSRVEGLCVAQEVSFAIRLPESEQLLRHTREKLTRPWWGAAVSRERTESQLRDLGVPAWIIKLRRRIFG